MTASTFFPRLGFSRHSMRSCVLLALGSFIASFLSSQVSAADDAALVEEIKNAWTTQASEVQSARVRARHISKPVKVPKTDWATVQAAVATLNGIESRGDDETTREAVVNCATKIFGSPLPPSWPVLTIIVDGRGVRNSEEFDDELKMDWGYNKGNSVNYLPSFKEVDIESGHSAEGRYGVSYLRRVPDWRTDWQITPPKSAKTVNLEHREKDYAVSVAVDRESKVARQISINSRTIDIQGSFAEYSGGVTMPGYGIHVSFRKGKVSVINAFIIEHAEFNAPVPPSELSIPVPKGTVIVDQRNPKHERISVAKSQGDAVLLADRLTGASYFSPIRFTIFAVVLLAGFGLAVIGVRRILTRAMA